MIPSADQHGLVILDDGECINLLASASVGRVGLSSGALPVVLPVNFVLRDRTIVFRTEAGLKLDAARANSVACVEIDEFDAFRHEGWSVLATGRMSEIVDPEQLAAAALLPLQPWAARAAAHFVALPIELLSGRRISHRVG